jgi:hypothetical protein
MGGSEGESESERGNLSRSSLSFSFVRGVQAFERRPDGEKEERERGKRKMGKSLRRLS